MTATELTAIAMALVLAALAAIHVYWAGGGRWGLAYAVPSRPTEAGGEHPVFIPPRTATFVVAAALASSAVVPLAAVDLVPLPLLLPPVWTRGALAAMAIVFSLRALGEGRYVGLTKSVVGTTFATWDRRLYTPLCAAMAVAAAFLWSSAP
ncbi:MAG: DUF3995 domain-containing protein [Myxococcota bacterium]